MLAPVLALALTTCEASGKGPAVLSRAYSHNDYERARPLLQALDSGFFAVEADVHLRGRELLIGHKGGDVKPGRTLQALYLDPLRARARANGGRVYRGGPKGFLLMVEFKSDGEQSYPVLRDILQGYREMLTSFTPDRIEEGAVTVVITGHRPEDLLREENLRLAGIDGDLGDLGKADKTLYPTISDDFRNYFNWRGGNLDGPQREKLERFISRARAKGRRIRFYGIPNREDAWELMYLSGVDLINTDRIEGLRDFLLKQVAQASARCPSPS